jgi:uncharacterized protein YjbI with pentapeptide repeats
MAAERDACAPPSLPRSLVQISSIDLAPDQDIDEAHLSGMALPNRTAPRVRITSSRLDAVRLHGCELQELEARDVIFDQCDLSGSDLSSSRLFRVEFRGCRLSGLVFSMSMLKDVKLIDCKADGMILRMSEGERFRILDSNLKEADFYAAKFRSSRMLRCDLSGSEFSQADLRGTHLQGSRLDGAKGAAGLQGIQVDPKQATLLSHMLLELHGISVEEAPED